MSQLAPADLITDDWRLYGSIYTSREIFAITRMSARMFFRS